MSIKTTSRQLVGKQTVKTSAVANSSTATAAATIVYDGEFDPFLNTVALHISGVPEYTDHLLKDKSSNGWDEYLADTRYDGAIVPSYFGPKYQDWATHFGELGYYKVDDIPTLRLGTSAFTIEFWIKLMRNDSTQYYIMGKGGQAAVTAGTGWTIGMTTTNAVFYYDAVSGVTVTGVSSLVVDTWYHVAIVRTSTASQGLKIYVDGVLVITGTSTGDFSDYNPLYIGRDRVFTAGTFFGGMLTDIRISGSAIYTGAFTKPTVALSMGSALYSLPMTSFNHSNVYTIPNGNLNDNTTRSRRIDSPFIDNSAMLTGHGSHCAEASDYYRYSVIYDIKTGNDSLKFGTGAFTVEAWIYLPSYHGSFHHIVGKGLGVIATAGTTGWALAVNYYGQLVWYDNAVTFNASADGLTRTITNYISVGTTTITGTVADTTGWQTGDYLNISGATTTEQIKLNGTWAITVLTGTTFSFVVSSSLTSGTYTTTLGTAVLRPAQAIYSCGWYHIAAVRTSTAANGFSMYVNGKVVYTGTVSSNYNQTNPLTLFASRPTDDGANFGGKICGLRLSTSAIYSSNFTADQTLLDASMTSSGTTSLLVCTTGTNPPKSNNNQWVDYGQSRLAPILVTSEFRVGGKSPTSRNGYSQYFYDASSNKIVVDKTSGDLDFGTGDFSIEFWHCNRYHWSEQTTYRYILDTRSIFSDTGITIRLSGLSTIEVWTNGKVVLTDSVAAEPSTRQLTMKWMHVCVQRVSGSMALYINGKRISESRFNGTINCPGVFTIGTGGYSSLQYTTGIYAWLADFRVLKGSAAYADGLTNPMTFNVPTTGLLAITNCVVLTFNQPILNDYSGRNNRVYWDIDRWNTSYRGNDVYVSNKSPYSGNNWDSSTRILADTSDSNAGFIARDMYSYTDSTNNTFSWITRMAKPWTIEMWIYGTQTGVGAPTQYTHLYNGNAGEGFQLRTHYPGYGYVSFSMWRAGSEYRIQSGAWDLSRFQAHSWNHIAVVFNPLATFKMALFCNGYRVAQDTGFPSGGTKTWTTYRLRANTQGMAEIRISTTPRYTNDLSVYTVPTGAFSYDSYTYTLIKPQVPFPELTSSMGNYSYGNQISYQYKKFGSGSLKFSNKETSLVNRTKWLGHSWGEDNLGARHADITIECWASWWDAAAGGEGFDATTGNWLYSFSDDQFKIGVSPITGEWKFQFANVNNVWAIIYSGVACATASSGRFDHLALVRRAMNWAFYVNGVETAVLIGSHSATYPVGQGPTQDLYNDFSTTNIKVGADYYDNATTSWSGFIQDLRISMMARYETAVVSTIPTMVYAGTRLPALPTKLFPTK